MSEPILVLIIISLVQAYIYSICSVEIFDWNPENGFMSEKGIFTFKNGNTIKDNTWEDRRYTIACSPCINKLYRFFLQFIGVLAGWFLISFALDRSGVTHILNIADTNRGTLLDIPLTLVTGLVGAAGRIPNIIDTVQNWIKK